MTATKSEDRRPAAVESAYQDLRKAGIPVRDALRHARFEVEHRQRRLILNGRKAHAVLGGVKVTVVLNADPLGWAKIGKIVYGTLGTQWRPGCLATPPGSRAPYFHPSQSYWEMRQAMTQQKMPKHEADTIARRLLKAQMNRALNHGRTWEYVIAYFSLTYRGQVFMESLDGIECDRTPTLALEEMLYREAVRRARRVRQEVESG